MGAWGKEAASFKVPFRISVLACAVRCRSRAVEACDAHPVTDEFCGVGLCRFKLQTKGLTMRVGNSMNSGIAFPPSLIFPAYLLYLESRLPSKARAGPIKLLLRILFALKTWVGACELGVPCRLVIPRRSSPGTDLQV